MSTPGSPLLVTQANAMATSHANMPHRHDPSDPRHLTLEHGTTRVLYQRFKGASFHSEFNAGPKRSHFRFPPTFPIIDITLHVCTVTLKSQNIQMPSVRGGRKFYFKQALRSFWTVSRYRCFNKVWQRLCPTLMRQTSAFGSRPTFARSARCHWLKGTPRLRWLRSGLG